MLLLVTGYYSLSWRQLSAPCIVASQGGVKHEWTIGNLWVPAVSDSGEVLASFAGSLPGMIGGGGGAGAFWLALQKPSIFGAQIPKCDACVSRGPANLEPRVGSAKSQVLCLEPFPTSPPNTMDP